MEEFQNESEIGINTDDEVNGDFEDAQSQRTEVKAMEQGTEVNLIQKVIVPQTSTNIPMPQHSQRETDKSGNGWTREIIRNIISFAQIGHFKRIAVLNRKWNKLMKTHPDIYRLYQLDFGEKFAEFWNGQSFAVSVNNKKRKLMLIPNIRSTMDSNSKLEIPYFYRAAKWIITQPDDLRVIPNRGSIPTEMMLKYFRENDHVQSVEIRNLEIHPLPINRLILQRLIHLSIGGITGTTVLKQIESTRKLPNLLFLELVNLQIDGEEEGFTEILQKVLDRCCNLIAFKFEAKESSNLEEIGTIRFPASIQWISLCRFTGYFDCDLSANTKIVGLHIKDMVWSPESITWPKEGCIQMLALEGFKGHNSTFIESWNEYIEYNKHQMNCRFVRSVKYPSDLKIRRGKSMDIAMALNQNMVDELVAINGKKSAHSNIWTLESFAKHQDAFNEYGWQQNPYLLTPIKFSLDRCKASGGERLWEVLLKISALNYEENHKIVNRQFELKNCRWIGSFGWPCL